MVEYFSLFIGSVFGLISLKTFNIVKRVYPYVFGRSYMSKIDPKSLKLAIITGSTDGLGKCFAKKLYQNKFKLVMLGRSENKLQNLVQQFQNSQTHSSENKIVPFIVDFSNFQLSSQKQRIDQITKIVENEAKTSQVSNFSSINLIIINSCGQAHISSYQNTELSQIQRIQSVNVNSFHFLLQVLFRLKSLEYFKNKNIPKQYTFINVSSGVDQNPNQYSSIYSASKASCSNMMKVLYEQNKTKDKFIKKEGVKTNFLNLTPLYIKTKMIRYLNDWDVVQPNQIVQNSFKLLKRKSEAAGSIKHQLLKQFPFVVNKKFEQRVNKALQVRNKMIQIQNKRKNRIKKQP